MVSKQPLHSRAAAKMSPHIRIGPEPVLTAHAPSPPAVLWAATDRQEKIQPPIAEQNFPAAFSVRFYEF